MPRSVRFAALLLPALFAACSDDHITGPTPADAARAADAFDSLASAVSASQGEGAAIQYRDAAWRLRTGARIAPVTLSIDGHAMAFSAVAIAESLTTAQCPPPGMGAPDPSMPCLAQPLGMRTLIAWERGAPQHVLLLMAQADKGGVGPVDETRLAQYVPPAELRYSEGHDRFWQGVSGSYASSMQVGDACPSPGGALPVSVRYPGYTCQQAEFTWELQATVRAPQNDWLFRANAATGTHSIALAPTRIPGTRLLLDMNLLRMSPDPYAALRAKLTAEVSSGGDDVALTLTLDNAGGTPVTLSFPSAQQYDFGVLDDQLRSVWRWSETMDFAAVVTQQTLAPGEIVRYTAHWTPTAHGTLTALGMVPARGIPLLVSTRFTVP